MDIFLQVMMRVSECGIMRIFMANAVLARQPRFSKIIDFPKILDLGNEKIVFTSLLSHIDLPETLGDHSENFDFLTLLLSKIFIFFKISVFQYGYQSLSLIKIS